MASGTLSEFIRDNSRELSKAIASRVRMDNPSFADRTLSDIGLLGERMCTALAEFLARLDWAPLGEFVDEVGRIRPSEFRASDVVGALTTAERTVLRYVEDHDPSGTLRSSPQWSRLEAGMHKLRTAIVECVWDAVSSQAAERLERAMSHLEAGRNGAEADSQKEIAAALEDIRKARAFLGKRVRRRPRARS
jgi:hypothetical protein